MATPLLLLVTAIYVWVAAGFVVAGNWPMAIMYAGYSFANIGPIMLVNQ
jgi:hypothetical protein